MSDRLVSWLNAFVLALGLTKRRGLSLARLDMEEKERASTQKGVVGDGILSLYIPRLHTMGPRRKIMKGHVVLGLGRLLKTPSLPSRWRPTQASIYGIHKPKVSRQDKCRGHVRLT